MIKPRDVQVYPIAPDTTVLRSRTWDRLKFEIEYGLQKGTTANSYLIRGDQIALIDPPGESFRDIFLKSLIERIDPQTIDYVILGHVNPNRCVTLSALLEIAPQITFVCSNPGVISLCKILDRQNLNTKIVKGDDTLDLGKGHNLEFILTPNPRFPDQLCTYDPKTEILYTDKLFVAHTCSDQVFDEGWKVYAEDRRYYFDCVIAPYAKQVANAIEKLKDKPAKIYGVGHGPLVKYGLSELTTSYQEWLNAQQSQSLNVALIYASAYGNTGILAQAIARGITKAGVAVESINAEFADPEEIKTAINKCSGFIFGSPTLGGHAPTPIQTALGITLANADKTKLAGVFGSYGWSGEAIDLLESKFRDAGYRLGFDPIRVKFKPTDAILKTCEEAGTDFAQAVKKVQKSRKPKSSSVSESQTARTEQALGRIIGSLCVVTTQKGDVRGGMLASWVSQATFNPPGLTIAVAKERAIESLLYTGNSFVLNILQEGKHLGLMKHFLKPFEPGEERFQGIDIEQAENGSPILKDALAYVECQVSDRMECGDHWVIYALAKRGKVLQEGVTAVHHRKTGSYY
ncbi:flavin reductase domain protein FMN-binding [Gloeothece citriformis PCC 7424]|uniref:Flavin reductase domain protein FMN-binding n=1 Tax=Gloeothece citriformis (strain PCC 7424) TaxID=65393 RepID=B7K8E1_GLOC7|nr:diflavin flavoprotein [Gloeothece citriformis]ACK69901.1 flavin reductase domain protein FMN-binding [Gloeothece citriformis PCC 7424]